MNVLETALGLTFAFFLAYFAFRAVGDDWPLNLAVAILAFVVSAGVLFSFIRGDRR